MRGVVDKVGMDGFNAVWTARRHLPHQGRDRRPGGLGHPGPRLTQRMGGRQLDPSGRRRPPRGPAGAAPTSSPATAVIVACSGGADSLALAAAAAFEGAARRPGWSRGATVDHGLQDGSAAVAAQAAGDALRQLGLRPVDVVRVEVGRAGGPEAAARDARYAALDALADRAGVRAVLLGHTLDDQAETVLLGLARGSGARSLAGMAAVDAAASAGRCSTLPRATVGPPSTRWASSRGTTRTTTTRAFARVRVRARVLPAARGELGPGVAAALAPDRRAAARRRRRPRRLGGRGPTQPAEDEPGARRGRRALAPARRRPVAGAPARRARGRRPGDRPDRGPRRRQLDGWSPTGTASAASTCPGTSRLAARRRDSRLRAGVAGLTP